jgi:hypothetical protein
MSFPRAQVLFLKKRYTPNLFPQSLGLGHDGPEGNASPRSNGQGTEEAGSGRAGLLGLVLDRVLR